MNSIYKRNSISCTYVIWKFTFVGNLSNSIFVKHSSIKLKAWYFNVQSTYHIIKNLEGQIKWLHIHNQKLLSLVFVLKNIVFRKPASNKLTLRVSFI